MKTEQIENLLIQKQIPVTSMRMLVLEEFLKSPKAISLSDLEEILIHSDRSTIYRTLKTFEKKGLIHGVQENNTTQYLLCHNDCTEEHHYDYHLHFYCSECKKTICLEEVNFKNVTIPKEYLIKELKFVASGICKDCIQSK